MTPQGPNNAKLLLVEDDQNLGELLKEEVEDSGMTATLVNTGEDALATAKSWCPDLIVSDLKLPGADGLNLLRETRSEMPEHPPDFLMITAFGTVAKAVESLKAGAEDFLTKPLDFEHFRLSINRVLEKRRLREEVSEIRNLIGESNTFHGMYGRSRAMQTLFQRMQQVANADGPVLITGESGTGKELVARALHDESKPENSPFLAVNCAGIPEHLLESEFFGHTAGAFTGADKSRQGLFAEAEGGTLLLDEIAEMPHTLQAKLLRMLQDGKIRPVGSNQEVQVNVRVLAATNHDIEELVRNNEFREDLFFRLETFSLDVPPLREREDDIDLLTAMFLKKHANAAGKQITGFAADAQEKLQNYSFPGNVRELENAIERAVVFCPDQEIRPEHLPSRIQKNATKAQSRNTSSLMNTLDINAESLPDLEEVQRRYIQHVVEKVDGNKKLAASILGIGRRTLYRHLDDLDR